MSKLTSLIITLVLVQLTEYFFFKWGMLCEIREGVE